MRGYSCIALDHPKSDLNVGSVLRAAHNYRAAFVCASGERYRGAKTDTPKGYRHFPFFQVDDVFDTIPYDCVPIAVDIIDGAKPLPTFVHPERAFYVFGPEDGTLGKRILDRCKYVVSIPTQDCMNLAACVNVVLYDRLLKALK